MIIIIGITPYGFLAVTLHFPKGSLKTVILCFSQFVILHEKYCNSRLTKKLFLYCTLASDSLLAPAKEGSYRVALNFCVFFFFVLFFVFRIRKK